MSCSSVAVHPLMRAWAVLAMVLAVLAGGAVLPGSAFAGAPQISDIWATEVTATSANLRAKIDPEGVSTGYRFEYLTQSAYEGNLAAARDGFTDAALAPASGSSQLGAGSAAIAVVQPIASLSPTTAYRYRVRALNAEGARYGPERILSTREPSNAIPPLDGRSYELVSPIDKGGGAVGRPESIFGGGDFQAADDGSAFTFSSAFSFAQPAGAPPVSQYLATREAAGWQTRNITAPLSSGGYGDDPDGSPFRVFSTDLARGLMLEGSRCAAAGNCAPSFSLWEGGSFTPAASAPGLHFLAATPDARHALFESEGGLYELSGGVLETISLGPGATLAAPIGAISEDGRRIYSFQLPDGPISLYEAGHAPRVLPGTTGVKARFQAAGANGVLAYFTVGSQLYRYSSLSEVTTPLASGVVGVLAVSADGETVYYQDAAGLERWTEGTVTTIVAGSEVATTSDYPPADATVRLSPDGEHLAFLSAAEIPPFDNQDAATGEPETELYLFGPPSSGGSPKVACVSCNPRGERPSAPARIPAALANGSIATYRPRALSDDGGRIFFETNEKLLISDTNSSTDVYEWEAGGRGSCSLPFGCLGLISGGRAEGGTLLDASGSGDDVFILTGESLLGSDPGALDVYDFRAGGGFPEPQAPFVCEGDACQPLPSPPEDPGVGSSVPTSGNPPLKYFKESLRHHHRKKHHKRHLRHAHRGEDR